MKKIIYSILAIALVFSCQDQDDHGVTVNDYNGTTPVVYYTNGVSGSYFVTPTATPFTIQVGATTTSAVDRTFTIEADASSTAQAGVDYDFVSTSVLIPAGSYFGEVEVQGIFAGTTAEGSSLVINLVGEGTMANSQYSLSIFQQCVSDLAGMYSVFTTYGYHDFLPSYSTVTMDMEIVEISDGYYSVDDFSGGLYSDGPYVGAYGTSGLYAEFTENCGLISWSGQSDPWGPMIPLAGGVNSVDANGVVTISWYCEGYGESGVSVYTPL